MSLLSVTDLQHGISLGSPEPERRSGPRAERDPELTTRDLGDLDADVGIAPALGSAKQHKRAALSRSGGNLQRAVLLDELATIDEPCRRRLRAGEIVDERRAPR